MNNEQIKAILLARGFNEKDQGDGRMDLNPYVYDAARALLTAQLAEIGWFPCSPELLQSGVCCATAPRVLGGQGYSHYHQAVAEPAWYEHTLRNERGIPVSHTLLQYSGNPFGKPDVDYSKEFRVTVEPLYKHSDPAETEQLRAELARCEAMAMMVAEREWAEHVGTGPVSSKVEVAFTQLHNELQEAEGKLADLEALRKDAERLERLDMLVEAYGCEDIHEGNTWEISGPYRSVRDAIDDLPPINPPQEPAPDEFEDLLDVVFSPGNGNAARRRANELGIDYDAAMAKEDPKG